MVSQAHISKFHQNPADLWAGLNKLKKILFSFAKFYGFVANLSSFDLLSLFSQLYTTPPYSCRCKGLSYVYKNRF